MVDSLEKEDILSQKVINFMRDDENFITHPDKKKEQLRYRLDYLHVFHEKFLNEYKAECSYSNYCELVINDVVKPFSDLCKSSVDGGSLM